MLRRRCHMAKLKQRNFDLSYLQESAEKTRKEEGGQKEYYELLSLVASMKNTSECDFSVLTPEKLYQLALFEVENEEKLNVRVRFAYNFISNIQHLSHVRSHRYVACL